MKLYQKNESRKVDEVIRSKEFRGRTILDENCLAISTTPSHVDRRKAFAVGFSILELSKLVMYKGWYDRICKTWPTAKLLATDTDR